MIAAPVLLAVASLASFAAAQSDSIGVGNQTIIPTSVDLNTRNGWCRSEKDTCTTLCSKNWSVNDCDVNTLNVTCTCADGSSPDLVNYRDTLPFFVCQEYIAQCVAGNATEPNLQSICRNTNTCGNMDPADFVPSTTVRTTTGPSPTTGGSNSSTGTEGPTTTGGSTDAPTNSPNSAPSLDASSYGYLRMFSLVTALGLAGFGLVL